MSPQFALTLILQTAAAAGVGWVTGDYLLGRLNKGPHPAVRLGAPERALAAIVGFCLVAIGLMLAHIVTGGAVFGSRAAVPVIALLIIWLGRKRFQRPRIAPAALWLGLVLALLYVLPVLVGGPGARVGDPSWHLGWTEQLLAGQPVPVGPAPGLDANAYPWGFHALLATLVRLVPGSEPLIALEAVQLMIVAGIPLAAACLARLVAPRAGLLAAAASALIGGFGWLLLSEPYLETTPYEAPTADLVVTSPNAVYEMLPPALPREVGLVLLGATAVVISLALQRRERRSAFGAGALAGVVGLFSVPMFVGTVAWLLSGWLIGSRAPAIVIQMLGTAAAVFALWAGPVAAATVRYGGLVDITPRLGREWGPVEAVASWGLLLPAALVGIVLVSRSREAAAPVLLGFAAACSLLLVLSIARAEFGWSLWEHETVLHQGRVWPQAHLLGGTFAGIAGARMMARTPAFRTVIAGLILALAAPSVLRASIDMHALLVTNREGFFYDSANLGEDSLVRAAAEHLDPNDVVRVDGPDALGFLLFQLSGVRLSTYDDPRLETNDLRIRFRKPAHAWEERTAGPGYPPDFEVIPAALAPVSGTVVAEGAYGGSSWVLVATAARES
ncbi:MAG: hypothetical protein ABR505_09635 [Actinomycetota bacterium]